MGIQFLGEDIKPQCKSTTGEVTGVGREYITVHFCGRARLVRLEALHASYRPQIGDKVKVRYTLYGGGAIIVTLVTLDTKAQVAKAKQVSNKK